MRYNFVCGAVSFAYLAMALSACSLIQSGPVTSDMPDVAAQTDAISRSITHVAGDVYRLKNTEHISILIEARDGMILIDPINDNAARWASALSLSRFEKPITHILYSHAHHDHTSGAYAIPDATVIGHANAKDVIAPISGMRVSGSQARWDVNADGAFSKDEAEDEIKNEVKNNFASEFDNIDTDNDGQISGAEQWTYVYRNVKHPDQTYDGAVNRLTIGGKSIEMHYLGGDHAADMSLIFLPEEGVLQIVDIVSFETFPYGQPTYHQQDLANIYETALAIPAKIVVPGHGRIGTLDDIRDHRGFMAALRDGVHAGIEQGQSLEQIQAGPTLNDYSHWEFYEARRPQNIAAMHRFLTAQ